jgi:hypothetical protein
MNQIYSKAYMEGHRQIIMSEQIIHKPDSVLEYTCFKGYVNDAANIESVFSRTTYWQGSYQQDRETADETITDTFDVYRDDFNSGDVGCNPTIVDGDLCVNNLAEALNYIVNFTLDSYLASNFSHTYLGEATTIDASGTPSGCADMATVWNIAKCLDFGEDDRFRTFESLVNSDPRTIPQECSPGHSFADDVDASIAGTKLDSTTPGEASDVISTQCPPLGIPVAGVNTNFSNNLINVANNCKNASGEHAYVEMDLVDYQDFLILGAGINSGFYIPGTGGDSDGTVTCADPLPTGIPVVTYEYDPSLITFFLVPEFPKSAQRNKFVHYEYVCPNPGCFYRPQKVAISETAIIPATTPLGTCVQY